LPTEAVDIVDIEVDIYIDYTDHTFLASFLRTAELEKLLILSKTLCASFSNPDQHRTPFPLSLAASGLPLISSLSSRPFHLNLDT
jgi:hypothetical protein